MYSCVIVDLMVVEEVRKQCGSDCRVGVGILRKGRGVGNGKELPWSCPELGAGLSLWSRISGSEGLVRVGNRLGSSVE